MRLKPCPTYRYNTPVRCILGVLCRKNVCLIQCTAGKQHLPLTTADILLLDATNILSRAAIDAKRFSNVPKGVSIRYCFEAWVHFLIAATTPTLMVIAVFDDPAAVS
jgi:hypothetical protein